MKIIAVVLMTLMVLTAFAGARIVATNINMEHLKNTPYKTLKELRSETGDRTLSVWVTTRFCEDVNLNKRPWHNREIVDMQEYYNARTGKPLCGIIYKVIR